MGPGRGDAGRALSMSPRHLLSTASRDSRKAQDSRDWVYQDVLKCMYRMQDKRQGLLTG